MIETENRDGIRLVTLKRPPVNALNLPLVQELGKTVQDARDDVSCTALVLTGVEGFFSAGIDTREVPRYDAATRSLMLRSINRMIGELYSLPKPVVAAVSGHALGGAFVIMLAADLRLAAAGDFRLGLIEAAAGVPFPAGPLAVVQAELSPENARLLALGSQPVGSQSLLERGILDRVVDPAVLVMEAIGEARRLATMQAYAKVKLQLRAAACERLRRIVEDDEEPMHQGWT
ncbi:MAG: enoyl-CoA hydratase/isomerase family protein [Nevskia sp.]|nr:enoyl-CoA hydratase/isomerase family protein [Nevskia sp.]